MTGARALCAIWWQAPHNVLNNNSNNNAEKHGNATRTSAQRWCKCVQPQNGTGTNTTTLRTFRIYRLYLLKCHIDALGWQKSIVVPKAWSLTAIFTFYPVYFVSQIGLFGNGFVRSSCTVTSRTLNESYILTKFAHSSFGQCLPRLPRIIMCVYVALMLANNCGSILYVYAKMWPPWRATSWNIFNVRLFVNAPCVST